MHLEKYANCLSIIQRMVLSRDTFLTHTARCVPICVESRWNLFCRKNQTEEHQYLGIDGRVRTFGHLSLIISSLIRRFSSTIKVLQVQNFLRSDIILHKLLQRWIQARPNVMLNLKFIPFCFSCSTLFFVHHTNCIPFIYFFSKLHVHNKHMASNDYKFTVIMKIETENVKSGTVKLFKDGQCRTRFQNKRGREVALTEACGRQRRIPYSRRCSTPT